MPKKARKDPSSDSEDETPVPKPKTTRKSFYEEKSSAGKQKRLEQKKNKLKCFICNQKGHTRNECPGVDDGGKGQSIYKGKNRIKEEKHLQPLSQIVPYADMLAPMVK
jgi:hypothetical protein